jgi:hypothetical protein
MKPLLRLVLGMALATLLLGTAACNSMTTGPIPPATLPVSATATGTVPPTTLPVGTATPTPSIPVKTFFSKHPDSDTNPSKVFPVERTAHSLAVATFATQQLLAGPTAAEAASGLFTPFVGASGSVLSGSSTCGGPDFKITLDRKGSAPEPGTATLQFCRALNLSGVVTDAQMQAELSATLTQFGNIDKAVILTQDGHCFGDESGMDLCLK